MTAPGAEPELTDTDPWHDVRGLTPARIGLGRVGNGLPLSQMLELQAARARARDAVHLSVDFDRIERALAARSMIRVHSAAADRATYLQRPDLGRRLDPSSVDTLARADHDVAFVVGDGLSATAVHEHAVPTLQAVLNRLEGWAIAPLVLARQARVALGDEIGALVGARMVVMLIGERPGLSASDSLGVYLTYQPQVGRRDSERNCISNIHPPHGLGYDTAADELLHLMTEARRLGLTGLALPRTTSPR